MNCTEFSNLLDAYLDGELSPEEAARLEAHAASCAECGALMALRRDCRDMDEALDVPVSFSAAWRQAIREEADKERKADGKRVFRRILTAAAALVFVVGGAVATRNRVLPSGEAVQAPDPAETPALAVMQSTAAPAPSAPVVYTTSLPLMDTAAEEADTAVGAGGLAKQAPDQGSLIAEAAVSNVVYSARADDAPADAEEDGGDMALPEEAAADDTAYSLMAAEESLAAEDMAAPSETEEAPPEAGEAIGPAEDSAPDDVAKQPGGFFREAGILALCALPWLAAAALAWLTARWIRNKKKGRKES